MSSQLENQSGFVLFSCPKGRPTMAARWTASTGSSAAVSGGHLMLFSTTPNPYSCGNVLRDSTLRISYHNYAPIFWMFPNGTYYLLPHSPEVNHHRNEWMQKRWRKDTAFYLHIHVIKVDKAVIVAGPVHKNFGGQVIAVLLQGWQLIKKIPWRENWSA